VNLTQYLYKVGNLRKILYTVFQSGATDSKGGLTGRLYSFFLEGSSGAFRKRRV